MEEVGCVNCSGWFKCFVRVGHTLGISISFVAPEEETGKFI
jgi:hypothetical protein